MRWIFAVLLSVAIGSAAVGAPPGPSPFEGSYSGLIPGTHTFLWSVSISSNGTITGSTTGGVWSIGYGDVEGGVSNRGRLSVHGTTTTFHPWEPGPQEPITRRFRCSANVALDGDGNLVGTASDGTTFTWTRR